MYSVLLGMQIASYSRSPSYMNLVCPESNVNGLAGNECFDGVSHLCVQVLFSRGVRNPIR